MNFREVDRKLCLIQDSRFVLALDPEQKTKANAVLFFGKINVSGGAVLSDPHRFNRLIAQLI